MIKCQSVGTNIRTPYMIKSHWDWKLRQLAQECGDNHQSNQVNSRLAWECLDKLNKLSSFNKVDLYWISDEIRQAAEKSLIAKSLQGYDLFYGVEKGLMVMTKGSLLSELIKKGTAQDIYGERRTETSIGFLNFEKKIFNAIMKILKGIACLS